MKNYRSTDYALNKYSRGIVYKSVDSVMEMTLEDYLRENPEKTEADFLELKRLSDAIYCEQDRQYNRASRMEISLPHLEYAENIPASSLGSDMETKREEEREKVIHAARSLVKSGRLTEIQRRRFHLYFFHGLSIRQIARQE